MSYTYSKHVDVHKCFTPLFVPTSIFTNNNMCVLFNVIGFICISVDHTNNYKIVAMGIRSITTTKVCPELYSGP